MEHNHQSAPINILLADDDADERYFFEAAVKELPISTNLTTVVDGTTLMDYLYHHLASLPDILFLDINMPRKNGKECLIEIKSSLTLKHIPVVMYSTTKNDQEIDTFYHHGANNFITKGKNHALSQDIIQALGFGALKHVH